MRRHGDEKDALDELPEFEQQIWMTARPYYAINQNSRNAALRIVLAAKIMRRCQPPVTEVPDHGKNKYLRHEPSVAEQAVTKARAGLFGSVTVELFPPELSAAQLTKHTDNSPRRRDRKALSSMTSDTIHKFKHRDCLWYNKVVLLAAGQQWTLDVPAMAKAEEVRMAIAAMWARAGVAGVVVVMY